MIADEWYKCGVVQYGLPIEQVIPIRELEQVLEEKKSVYADKKTRS